VCAVNALVNSRAKRSMLIGLALSLSIHALSAIISILYPYRDVPMMPKPVFLFLLLPGGVIGGYLWPSGWLNTVIEIAINSVFYGFLFLLSTLRNGSALGACRTGANEAKQPSGTWSSQRKNSRPFGWRLPK